MTVTRRIFWQHRRRVLRCGQLGAVAPDVRQWKHPRGWPMARTWLAALYVHNAIALIALSRRENSTVFQKTLTLNDFYLRAPTMNFRWETSR